MKTTDRFFLICTMLVTLGITSACGGDDPKPEAVVTRTPHPTFTPTAVQATVAPTVAAPAPNTGGPVDQQQEPATTAEKPIAVVNDELVNIRRGPGTDQEILATVGRGEQYEVVGQNPEEDWWQVCCVDGEPGWVFYAYVDTSGPVDQLAAAAPTNTPAPPPTNTPAPAAAPVEAPAQPAAPEQPAAPTDTPAPTATAAPAFPFNLVASEQFPEGNNLVRVFLYVYQGDQALGGYSVHVKKDGVDMPVSATSAETAGFTWPVANPRQRFQNMKVEFTGVQAAGVWEVQLVDGSGAPAGPPATFTIGATDTNRELYVRYEKP